MAGIFPKDGVECSQAFNASCDIETTEGCEPLFYSRRCLENVDTNQINAIISELGNFITCLGGVYDCNSLTNLCEAFMAFTQNLGNPSGTMIMWPTETPPDGYLKCNGAIVSRTTYAKLFAAIGTRYGAGDGATTFGIPDMRGEFPRGLDEGRGVDPQPGRFAGSVQGDAIRNITGTVSGNSSGYFDRFHGAFYDIGTRDGASARQLVSNNLPDDFGFDASRVVPTSSENRPRNMALVFCIKV